MDATTKKLMERLEQIEFEMKKLRREKESITTALEVTGSRPPGAHKNFYTQEENSYGHKQPFEAMTLTDACLQILRDYAAKDEIHEQWLDKNQIEYLVVRGGFKFKTEDTKNSVNVTLRRLAEEGYCEAHVGKGTRATRYHFRKDRVPNDVKNQGTTKR